MKEWIVHARTRLDLTQTEVAEAAGISQPSLCRIEQGKAIPKVQTAKTLGAILGVDWARFYEDIEAAPREKEA